MADNTNIEWTEATWNPVTGCSVTSPGCTNCYAMKLAGTRLQHHPSRAGLTTETKAGPVWNGQVRFNEQWLDQPLRWKRPRMIFVCAHGDLFHESVPDEWIDRVFAVMALAPQHTFQVLTKRSDRMREYFTDSTRSYQSGLSGWRGGVFDAGTNIVPWDCGEAEPLHCLDEIEALPNVWLGVSVEDQQRADERVPDLLATPAAVRWLSCEPLLGPVDLTSINPTDESDSFDPFDSIGSGWHDAAPKIDWVVAGGESGPGARPMHPDWARSLRDQCADAGVPFFFKQWGEFDPEIVGSPNLRFQEFAHGRAFVRVGKKAAGRLLDGIQHDGMPGHAD